MEHDATNATPEKKSPPPRIWHPLFLAALSESGNVRAACEAAGVDRVTAYRHRKRSDPFRAQWEQALEAACDLLEAEAWRRARTASDLLLIFLLKAHRPALYRETIRHQIDITASIRQAAEAAGLDPDEVVKDAEAIVAGHARPR